jgi:copper chaperone
MRIFVYLAMLVLISMGCNPKKSAKDAGANAEPVNVELSVSGMSCMGCVETVRYSISQVEGVDTVSVSLDQANAQVTFNPGVTDTIAIRKAVELNGYKVTAARVKEEQ